MRDHNYFDRYARHLKMFPQGKRETDLGTILLADSEEPIVEGSRIFYRTGSCVYRCGSDFAQYNDYELTETGGSHSERDVRLEEAFQVAYDRLKDLHAAGFYDDDRKTEFSQPD